MFIVHNVGVCVCVFARFFNIEFDVTKMFKQINDKWINDTFRKLTISHTMAYGERLWDEDGSFD